MAEPKSPPRFAPGTRVRVASSEYAGRSGTIRREAKWSHANAWWSYFVRLDAIESRRAIELPFLESELEATGELAAPEEGLESGGVND